ncbi:MAG: hypothetical protein LBU32_28160 [Clostridiales bacterium]|nr:hypothetical protein [Clostridiales bacterium]
MKIEFILTASKAMLHALVGIVGFVLIQAIESLAFHIPSPVISQVLNALVRAALLFVLFSLYCRKALKKIYQIAE